MENIFDDFDLDIQKVGGSEENIMMSVSVFDCITSYASCLGFTCQPPASANCTVTCGPTQCVCTANCNSQLGTCSPISAILGCGPTGAAVPTCW